ncbi:MAG: hypothetical protein ACTSPY_12080 [Candidatus Helarchaeota archaeon]
MVKLDKKRVDEAVSEIMENPYFQNVLSQVKKIRSLRKDHNLKERAENWRQITSDNEYFKLDYYLKYYKFESPEDKPEFFPDLKKLKDEKIKILKNDENFLKINFDQIEDLYILKNHDVNLYFQESHETKYK